jgi:Asp-tRNA(Asn)/Glu-tRNA(Gln) amidotransferase A subunit family amidase
MSNFAAVEARHRDLMAHEAARVHAGWHRDHGDRYDPRTAALVERGLAVDEARAEECRNAMLDFRSELTTAMNILSLSAWLAPAACGPAPAGLGSTGDPVMSLPWTHAGLPALTLPAGLDRDGLPLGLQVVGRYLIDEQLLALAGLLRDRTGIGLPEPDRAAGQG